MENKIKFTALIICLSLGSGTAIAKSHLATDQKPSPWPDVACPSSVPSATEQSQRFQQLKSVIENSINNPRYTLSDGDHVPDGIFKKGYDFHSVVEAYWALLSISRVTGDQNLQQELLKKLTKDELEKYRVWLGGTAAPDKFYIRFGQGWLLLLFNELSKMEGVDPALVDEVSHFRLEVQNRILNWLETEPFPENPDGSFSADQHSLLFLLALFQLSRPPAATSAALNEIQQKRFVPLRNAVLKQADSQYDFLYLPSVLALIDMTNPANQTGQDYPVEQNPPPLAQIGPENSHLAGKAVLRNWPYALESEAGGATACARFNTNLAEMFARPDQWNGDYDYVAHWVPQYMWMDMWLGMGGYREEH